MLSKAWISFDESADDIRRLLDVHTTLGGDARGRRYRLEVLNKSAIVLITAIWEAYCEDLAAEALEQLVVNANDASSLPKELKKQIASEIKADRNDLAMWELADASWKKRVQRRLADLTIDRNRKLNTPKSEGIDQLFRIAIGLTGVSDAWRWSKTSAELARKKLDRYVSLRGAIAHRGKGSASVKKADVEDYFQHARLLAERTGWRVTSFVETVIGKYDPVPKNRILAEGPCVCERRACVGSDSKMYCYWRVGLSEWVIKKKLYWRCYDEKILCPRCPAKHMRGHVGKLGVCSSPYRDQAQQTD